MTQGVSRPHVIFPSPVFGGLFVYFVGDAGDLEAVGLLVSEISVIQVKADRPPVFELVVLEELRGDKEEFVTGHDIFHV